MSAIHQFVPMLHRSDAVGRHTLRLREVMVERGITSHIYVELVDPDTESETRPYADYADEAERGDVLIYQFATASGIARFLRGRPETLVVNYHNVTPPHLYASWDNGLARHQLRAQMELRELAARTTLGLAVSAFNESELREAGYARTAVVPPAAMVPARPTGPADATAARTAAGARWVSVGRLAPNKGIEFAVMALLVAREHHDPAATLQVVGRPVLAPYTAALHRFVDEMGLHDAVTFSGALSDADLLAALAGSDVLVVSSQHEGFGVPVIEAMTVGLPVVANAVGALPEVVGDGGLLVDATDPWALSSAVAGVLGDDALRASLATTAARRIADLDLSSAGDRAVDLVTALQA